MFQELAALFRDFRMLVADVILGRARNCLENSVRIDAPRDEVWAAFWSTTGRKEWAESEHHVEEINGEVNLYRMSWANEGIYQSGYMRVIDAREPEGFIADRFYEEEDIHSEFVQKFGMSLVEAEDGKSTIVNQYDFVEDLGLVDRLLVSFESRWMLRAFRDCCERKAPEVAENVVEVDENEAFWAVLSSAVAFFGCWYFYDLSWAVLILMALVFHEIGHVFALNLLGINTPGLTLLPFVGGNAMDKLSFRSDLEQAFCSLMGAVVSLAPCFIFFVLYLISGQAFFGIAATIFAFVNLLSLLPIYPFDGGRILDTLMSSIKYVDVVAALGTMFIIGFILAVVNGYYIFALVGAITMFCVYQPLSEIIQKELETIEADGEYDVDANGQSSARMSSTGALIILAGLSTCVASYVTILYVTMSDVNVSFLLGYF